jgi:hypothetical protein
MRKLLFILGLLTTVAAKAQDITYGLTSRFGVYKTIVSSRESVGANNTYGRGLQLQLGGWLRKQVAEKGAVQLAVLQDIERQGGGTILVIDGQGYDITNLKTRYGNLAIGANALYLYQLRENLAVGAGLGASYTYVAVMALQELEYGGYHTVGGKELYNNYYHRKLRFYVPLEVQQKLSSRLQLVGQVKVPLGNKIAASESAFRERDLGLALGVNYAL